MSTRALSVTLACVIIASCTLSGLMFVRALHSQLAVQDMDVELVRVRQPEWNQFVVDINLVNRGRVATGIVSVGLFLRWEGREIAYEKWEPEELVVEPYGDSPATLYLRSPLSEEDLPPAGGEAREEWSARVQLEVTHPMREGIIMLYRRTELGP